MRLRNLFGTKRGIATVVVAGALVAAGAGIAVADFSASSNTVTGDTHDGTLMALSVQFTQCTGTIFPGAPNQHPTTATCEFIIVNHTKTHGQTITKETYTLVTGKTGATPTPVIVTSNTTSVVPGCYAKYFTVASTPRVVGTHITATPGSGHEKHVHVKVGLATGPTENACQGSHPSINLTVTGKA